MAAISHAAPNGARDMFGRARFYKHFTPNGVRIPWMVICPFAVIFTIISFAPLICQIEIELRRASDTEDHRLLMLDA